MRKITIILLFLLIIAGCAKKEEVVTEVPENKSTEVAETKLVNPIVIGDDIISYLEGFWIMYTNDPETNMSVTLYISNGEVTIANLDDEYIAATLTPFA